MVLRVLDVRCVRVRVNRIRVGLIVILNIVMLLVLLTRMIVGTWGRTCILARLIRGMVSFSVMNGGVLVVMYG